MCSLAGEVQCSKEGEPFSEFLAQDEWWMEREKKLKGQARDHVFAGDHSLPIPLPPWLFLCLSLFLSFHPNPNNWSLQIPVQMSFLFSSPMLLTFMCLGRNSSPWLLIYLFSCARRLVKIFAYNKPFKILNNSEMYNSLLSCK